MSAHLSIASFEKVGKLCMSFDVPMDQVLQYAFNIFGSVSPLIYLFVGAAFAIFILSKILAAVKKD